MPAALVAVASALGVLDVQALPSAMAQLQGSARVIDGDTLEVRSRVFTDFRLQTPFRELTLITGGALLWTKLMQGACGTGGRHAR